MRARRSTLEWTGRRGRSPRCSGQNASASNQCRARTRGTAAARCNRPSRAESSHEGSVPPSNGRTWECTAVSIYTLNNAHGIELQFLDYGGNIVSLKVPDRTGRLDDIVLGFDSLSDYQRASPYFGAIIRRYGNRLARGAFPLDGRPYTLATHNGPTPPHGALKAVAN